MYHSPLDRTTFFLDFERRPKKTFTVRWKGSDRKGVGEDFFFHDTCRLCHERTPLWPVIQLETLHWVLEKDWLSETHVIVHVRMTRCVMTRVVRPTSLWRTMITDSIRHSVLGLYVCVCHLDGLSRYSDTMKTLWRICEDCIKVLLTVTLLGY